MRATDEDWKKIQQLEAEIARDEQRDREIETDAKPFREGFRAASKEEQFRITK